MSFFQRMMAALQRFMTGRYGGMDSLNMFLITLYLLFAVFQLFFRTPVLYILSIIPAVLFFSECCPEIFRRGKRKITSFWNLPVPYVAYSAGIFGESGTVSLINTFPVPTAIKS